MPLIAFASDYHTAIMQLVVNIETLFWNGSLARSNRTETHFVARKTTTSFTLTVKKVDGNNRGGSDEIIYCANHQLLPLADNNEY